MLGLELFTKGLYDKPKYSFHTVNLGTRILDEPIRKLQHTPALPQVKADIGPSWLLQPIMEIPTFRYADRQDSDHMRMLFPERGQPIYERLLKAPVVPRSWGMVSPGDTLGVPKGANIANLITPRDETLDAILATLRKGKLSLGVDLDTINKLDVSEANQSKPIVKDKMPPRPYDIIPVQPVLTDGFEEEKLNTPDKPIRKSPDITDEYTDEPQPVLYEDLESEGKSAKAVETRKQSEDDETPPSESKTAATSHIEEAKVKEPVTETRYGDHTIDGWMEKTSEYHLEGESILEQLKTSIDSKDPNLVDKCKQAIEYAYRTSKFLDNRFNQEKTIPAVHKGYFTYKHDSKPDLYGLKPVRDILTKVLSISQSDKETIGKIRRTLDYYTKRVNDLPEGTYQRSYVTK